MTSPETPNRPSVWSRLEGLAYGGDYNPEQWPEEIRLEDIELMKEAGVNFLSVGIFSWGLLEPTEGNYDFGWLDDVMDNLHGAGIKVALATATASPPAWLARKYPEILPVTAEGVRLERGSRRHYTPSSSVYRKYATAMTRVIAERYNNHPALALWHVDNELGCHVGEFHGEEDAAAFRAWLERRYGSIEALNEAWGTAFWSQHYASFDEILPPGAAPTTLNPGQQLDFARFNSWVFIDYYRELLAVIREVTPDVPATTNFMVSSATKTLDYFDWSKDMDVIANDHYLVAADPERNIELAFSADLTRGVSGGEPWILMEHSTSAVNWQPHNQPKMPGEMLRNSLTHVARGADAVMFFQWRQSKAGSEKFHSAMVPHGGRDTQVWRNVVDLGDALTKLEPVKGSRVESRVAIVFDYEAWWASELDSHPNNSLKYLDTMRAFHRSLYLRGITADFVHPSADLSGYDLILVCTLYAVTDADAASLAAATQAGATVLITYFSGIVDEQDHIRLGGYPGAFRELLGIRSEEFHPLFPGTSVTLSDGKIGSVWSEHVHAAADTEVLATFTDFPLGDVPALTRRSVGTGSAWYLATLPDADGIDALTARLVDEAGVTSATEASTGVELVRRRGADGRSFLFAINHSREDVTVKADGGELLSGQRFTGVVPAGAVAVIAED